MDLKDSHYIFGRRVIYCERGPYVRADGKGVIEGIVFMGVKA